MKIFNLKLIFCVSFLALMALGCSNNPPSDSAMEEKFHSQEADFKRLVTMIREDARIESVEEKGAYRLTGSGKEPSQKTPGPEITQERLDEYSRLLRQTGVKNIFRTDNKVVFIVWSDGDSFYERNIDPGTFQSKDYVYTEELPAPLINALDDPGKLPKGKNGNAGYKKITDNWFLYFLKD